MERVLESERKPQLDYLAEAVSSSLSSSQSRWISIRCAMRSNAASTRPRSGRHSKVGEEASFSTIRLTNADENGYKLSGGRDTHCAA